MPQQPPPFFILAVGLIENRQCQRVQKYRRGLLERHAMLVCIGRRLDGIPLKIVNSVGHGVCF